MPIMNLAHYLSYGANKQNASSLLQINSVVYNYTTNSVTALPRMLQYMQGIQGAYHDWDALLAFGLYLPTVDNMVAVARGQVAACLVKNGLNFYSWLFSTDMRAVHTSYRSIITNPSSCFIDVDEQESLETERTQLVRVTVYDYLKEICRTNRLRIDKTHSILVSDSLVLDGNYQSLEPSLFFREARKHYSDFYIKREPYSIPKFWSEVHKVKSFYSPFTRPFVTLVSGDGWISFCTYNIGQSDAAMRPFVFRTQLFDNRQESEEPYSEEMKSKYDLQ